MSLESLLEQNINAQRDLITAVNLLTAVLGKEHAGMVQPQKVQPLVQPAKETAPAAPVKTSEPAGTSVDQKGAVVLDYEKDVKPLVLKVSSTKGRDACTALLGKFSLASAKAAVPAQYADIIAACQEALK